MMKLRTASLLSVASALSSYDDGCINGSAPPSVSVESTSPFALSIQRSPQVVQNLPYPPDTLTLLPYRLLPRSQANCKEAGK